MADPTKPVNSHGFPVRQSDPWTQEGEGAYANSLCYFSRGKLFNVVELPSRSLVRTVLVHDVYPMDRRVVTCDGEVFGYCVDRRWRSVGRIVGFEPDPRDRESDADADGRAGRQFSGWLSRTPGQVDAKFRDQILDVPEEVHPQAPVDFVLHAAGVREAVPLSGEPTAVEHSDPHAHVRHVMVLEREAEANRPEQPPVLEDPLSLGDWVRVRKPQTSGSGSNEWLSFQPQKPVLDQESLRKAALKAARAGTGSQLQR